MEKGPQTHEMSQENAFFTQNQSFKIANEESLLGINVLNVESRITAIFELLSRSLRADVSYFTCHALIFAQITRVTVPP